jgi:hypothetical protein
MTELLNTVFGAKSNVGGRITHLWYSPHKVKEDDMGETYGKHWAVNVVTILV